MFASPYYWWVQSVMPVVFDNSLSYYEVLAKLTNYMEGIIGDVDQIEKILATIEGIEDVTQFTEFLESIQSEIGTLENLSTTNKSDLVSAINEVAQKANNAYVKPVSGIPEVDLSQEVRDKLNNSGGGGSTSYIINNRLLAPAPTNNSPTDLGLGTYSVPAGGIPESTLSQEVRAKLNSGSGGTSDYSYLTNKPQINGHTLNAGNNSSQYLELGTGDYNELINKPQINGHTLIAGNNSSQTLGLGTYSKPAGGIPESDLSDTVVNKLNTSGGIADENTGSIAQRDYEIGELVYIDGVLYKVTMRTLTGSNFVIGTNIVATDINDELIEINSKIDEMASGQGLDSWTLSTILEGAGVNVEQTFFEYIRCTGGEDYLFIINRFKYAAPFVLKIYTRDGTLIDTQTVNSTSYNDYRFTFTPEDTGDYYCAILMTASGSNNAYITVTVEYTQSQGITELWNQINAAQNAIDAVEALEPLVEQNTEDISDLKSALNYGKTAPQGYVLTASNTGHGSIWSPAGLPTDEQTAQAVSGWLDDHPEATTTVQDHSLTHEKMVNGTLGFVTPEMFGARGDGSNDDTIAVQACFDSGCKNVLLYNSYKITDPIVVSSNTTIFGTKNSKIIIRSAEKRSAFDCSNANNIIFDGLNIEGNSQYDGLTDSRDYIECGIFAGGVCDNLVIKNCHIIKCGQAGIFLKEVSNVLIKDTYISYLENSSGSFSANSNYNFGIRMYTSAENVTINNVEVYDCAIGFYLPHGGSDIKILNCYVHNISGQHGFYCATANFTMRNTKINNVHTNAINIQYDASSEISDMTVITDNYIHDCGMGVAINNIVDETTVFSNITIRNNFIEKVDYGVYFGSCTNIYIEGNTIKNVNRMGVFVVSDKTTSNCWIADNMIIDPGQSQVSGYQYGIQVKYISNVNIERNIIISTDGKMVSGVHMTATATGVSLIGNTIKGSTATNVKIDNPTASLIACNDNNLETPITATISYTFGMASNQYSGASAPSTGYHARGEIMFNTQPSSAGNVGWICVSTGTPGTWKEFGTIA